MNLSPEMKAAIAKIHCPRCGGNTYRCCGRHFADENEVLRATISRLRVYAEHTTGCDSWAWPGGMKKPHAKCDCGYDELMAELEEGK